MDESWTLSELVAEVEARIGALPAPSNGQVRAVPDERTVRYYGTLGLLDRPLAMRGRTALYGRRHLAQVVAIKRLQTMGRSLAEIQALWPTLDDVTLARMSGIELPPGQPPRAPGRREFWKSEPATTPPAGAPPPALSPVSAPAAVTFAAPPVELRVELAPGVSISIAMSQGLALSSADVRAIRAAAAPLLDELVRCRLA